MFVWKEGQEFKLSDPVGWHSLQVGAGMVIEVLLTGEAAGGHSDLWAGLLVTSVHLAGDDDPYLLLYVKSLGCSDPDVSKRLSSWFNRRAGQVHLCLSDPCLLEEDCPLHVTTLRVYSPEGFKRDYMTAATVKQLKKWLEDLGLDDPADRPRPEGIPPPAGAGAGEEEEEPGFPLDGFAGHGRAPARDKEKKELGDERVAAEERQGLRERLMKVRERMTGRLGDNGAGKRAGRPRGVEDPIYVSSSEGYSPSELDAVAKEEKKVKKDKTKRKRKERPLDPAGPSRALAIPGKELRVQFDEEPGQRDRKKKKMRAAQTEGVAVEAAISGTTTGSLQRQLMARAAEAVNERQAKKKEKKTSKDPGKQLAQILTKVVGKKKNKKDKAKRRRRKKKGGGEDPPGGGSGDSSGSSQTSSCEGGSGGLSGDDETSSSESAKMQPPLRRKALQHPGSVLRMLIEHARERLDQTSKVSVGRRDEDDATQGIRISSYFQIVVRSQLSATSPQLRELHLLAHAVDLLRSGELDSLGDLLASRFVSLHQAGLDGHWGAARHMEVLSYEDTSAAGPAIVLKARKHAKMAAQVAGNEPGSWKGGGKGRGKFRPQWEDNNWQGDGKGRGKKGDKGRGRGKGAWKGQQQQEVGADSRQREKIPEK